MPWDVYRAPRRPPRPRPFDPGPVLEELTIPFLALGIGLLFVALGVAGGAGLSVEAGLGVVALFLGVRGLREAAEALDARRHERNDDEP